VIGPHDTRRDNTCQ